MTQDQLFANKTLLADICFDHIFVETRAGAYTLDLEPVSITDRSINVAKSAGPVDVNTTFTVDCVTSTGPQTAFAIDQVILADTVYPLVCVQFAFGE